MKPFTEEIRYEYPLTAESLVVDAGAYRGDFTAEIVNRYNCNVIALEPVECFYQGVRDRFSGNPKVQCLQVGLGSSERTTTFRIKGCMTGQFADSGEEAQVRLVPLGELASGPIDLLKLNIEGMEFDVLESLPNVPVCRNIQVQFHPVLPGCEARWKWIRERMLQAYELTFDFPWVWENYRLK